jgi:hypothetical protein
MSLIDFSQQARVNPLEVVERMAATNDWSFERAGDDEITILVRGKWTDYQVSFTAEQRQSGTAVYNYAPLDMDIADRCMGVQGAAGCQVCSCSLCPVAFCLGTHEAAEMLASADPLPMAIGAARSIFLPPIKHPPRPASLLG